MKKILSAAIIGDIVEWVDFILFSFFVPIFAVLFFPTKNQFLSIFIVLSTIAGSLCMRFIDSNYSPIIFLAIIGFEIFQ